MEYIINIIGFLMGSIGIILTVETVMEYNSVGSYNKHMISKLITAVLLMTVGLIFYLI